MRVAGALAALVALLAGCSSSSTSTSPTPTGVVVAPAVTPTSGPTETPAAKVTPGVPASPIVPHPATPKPRPTAPVVTVGRPYRIFMNGLCSALVARNADAVIADLPYYEYNSGLRYGPLGTDPGQSADPSILSTWLAGPGVRCRYFTPGILGHGTILTSGWSGAPATWALIEADLFNGRWKINDLTFGAPGPLYQAMHTAGPIRPFHG